MSLYRFICFVLSCKFSCLCVLSLCCFLFFSCFCVFFSFVSVPFYFSFFFPALFLNCSSPKPEHRYWHFFFFFFFYFKRKSDIYGAENVMSIMQPRFIMHEKKNEKNERIIYKLLLVSFLWRKKRTKTNIYNTIASK